MNEELSVGGYCHKPAQLRWSSFRNLGSTQVPSGKIDDTSLLMHRPRVKREPYGTICRWREASPTLTWLLDLHRDNAAGCVKSEPINLASTLLPTRPTREPTATTASASSNKPTGMSDDQVPPFSLDKPRYDTSTYIGRWRKFAELVSPKWLFLTSEQIQHATQTLEGFRNGTLPPGQFKDAELWNLRQAYEAAVHPQTGETVSAAFRLSAFVPVNIPICVGMLLAPPTLANTIFWQWVNQSYSAGFNYANRNASSEQDNSTILKSYGTATFVSCSTAVGLGKMVEKAKRLSPGTRSFLGKMVPFVAVASAGAFNAVSMRFNEFQEGIDIMDEHGDVHGRSVAAGRKSLGEVALTRVALPMPILLLPPYLYEVMKKHKIMPQAKYPKLAAELVVLTLCLWGAMPSAVALFPQNGTISADSVEEEFRSRVDRHGQPIRHFIYNKGI